ncbi:MAG: cytochrome c nitrite reductase small subunit [Phycisphaeraceae bacterium]
MPGIVRRVVSLPVIAAVAFGVLCGVSAFTFHYAEGTSYLSSDPRACVNCHIMQEPYDAWVKSSHHAVARCVDCHLPHDFVGKWLAKSDNGFFHSWAFTFQDFHEPIQIKPRNRRIVQENCLSCHQDVVHEMFPTQRHAEMNYCVRCHADVGHAGVPPHARITTGFGK